MIEELTDIKERLVILEDHAADKLYDEPYDGAYNPWRSVRTKLDEAIFRIELAMEDIVQYRLE